ncbi:MAG: hypothetical protein QF787_17375 [Nitrospinota bacterium]|jgi:hypothetical protein|nr:hypothetical protein [Nitrospinota bacterium]
MALKKFFGKKSEDDWDYDDDILGPSDSSDGDDDDGSSHFELDDKDQEVVRGISIRARAYVDYNKRKIATILSKLNDIDK